ncbi:MAG: MFS transporter [bacterium]|nr:MFS transporter [bacterium]
MGKGSKVHEKLKANIWKFYLMSALMSMWFFMPVYVLFLVDNGLSMFQIMLLESLYGIGIVALEIPTGYFADVHGRKKSLVIAGAALFAAPLFFSLGSTFFVFFIAGLFWSVGASFLSGADSALIYDTLLNLKRQKDYKKVMGNTFFIATIAVSFALIVGGLIASVDGVNLRLPFYVTLPFAALMPIVALSFKEPEREKPIIEKGHVHRLFEILKFSLKKHEIRWLMLYPALVLVFCSIAYMFSQPYLVNIGFDIKLVGLILAALSLAAGFSAKYAHTIEQKIGKKNSIVSLAVVTSISLFMLGVYPSFASVLFFILIGLITGYSFPLISDYINKLVSSDKRATVASIASMIRRLVYAVMTPFVGYFADLYSIEYAFILSGIIVAVGSGILLLFLKKDKVI